MKTLNMKIPFYGAIFFVGNFWGEQLDKNLSLGGDRQGFFISQNATRVRIKKGNHVSRQGARGEGPKS